MNLGNHTRKNPKGIPEVLYGMLEGILEEICKGISDSILERVSE